MKPRVTVARNRPQDRIRDQTPSRPPLLKKQIKPRAVASRRKSRPKPPASPQERVHLQLYITGSSPRSVEAVNNLHALCEEHLARHYALEVIDLYQEPARAAAGQIIVSPTLVKRPPKPLMRMVGNLASREQLPIKLQPASLPSRP